jgi:hypothetical protein
MASSNSNGITKLPPKRGGIHPFYGTFLGGATLDDEYKTTGEEASLYRFSTQRRNVDIIGDIERPLQDHSYSSTSFMFNGKLEPPEGNGPEIGKERFIRLVERRVTEHGQQTFYCIRDTKTKVVVDLFEHVRRFDVDTVIEEHNRRSHKMNSDFEQYDQYEFDEIERSRMVVNSLLSESFGDTIEARFGHLPNFDTLPGSCIFMMAIEACNASMVHEIERACQKLESMTLDSFPGEDVTGFATSARKLIMVMQCGYALPVTTGSCIITKLTKTSSEFFNRKMCALLDEVQTMERTFRFDNPLNITIHPQYETLGPLGIISMLQQVHGDLVSEHDWPALSNSRPRCNNHINNR